MQVSANNICFALIIKDSIFCSDFGEVPERSNGAVSKTVVPSGTQGSNPCLSALSIKIKSYALKESIIFNLAAFTAGRKPPTIPIISANIKAVIAIVPEISKLNAISENVSQLVVDTFTNRKK